MNSLVLELQKDALDKNTRVSDLLRKAFVVSKKLGIIKIEKWLENELNGYPSNSNIPDYRTVYGQIKVWNPYQGWQFLNFKDPKKAEILSKRKINQSIGELDSIAENNKNVDLQVPFSQENINKIMKSMDTPLHPVLFTSYTEVIKIINVVRNTILNWSLQLEKEGIMGESMSFSKKEKQIADKATYQITNYIGSMHNSQIQQDSSGAIQKLNIEINMGDLLAFIAEIKKSIEKLDLEKSKKQKLIAETEIIKNQANSPKPNKKIIFESLKTLKTILEGIVGNIIATGLLVKLGQFFLSNID